MTEDKRERSEREGLGGKAKHKIFEGKCKKNKVKKVVIENGESRLN
jgi:hypothetical protein